MTDLVGTNSADNIIGTSSGETILAGNGSDVVDGGAGNDLIDGGNGNDTLDGGLGSDTLRLIVTSAIYGSQAFRDDLAHFQAMIEQQGTVSGAFASLGIQITSF